MAAADGGTTGTDGAGGGQPPGVRIDRADNSAFNFGQGGSASTTNTTYGGGQGPDPAQRALLDAVRKLREDLDRFVATDDTRVLDAELVAAEDEIDTSGAASRTRLEALRDALATAGTFVAALGSGVAVSESVASLLRG
ncbi:hypothetical protein [Streptomyces phytohabitans]|uniref:hypothetical protein n=1 Tax=Streptomyces phytohabitans TaxID=1150371 RepID=UPI00345BE183